MRAECRKCIAMQRPADDWKGVGFGSFLQKGVASLPVQAIATWGAETGYFLRICGGAQADPALQTLMVTKLPDPQAAASLVQTRYASVFSQCTKPGGSAAHRRLCAG